MHLPKAALANCAPYVPGCLLKQQTKQHSYPRPRCRGDPQDRKWLIEEFAFPAGELTIARPHSDRGRFGVRSLGPTLAAIARRHDATPDVHPGRLLRIYPPARYRRVVRGLDCDSRRLRVDHHGEFTGSRTLAGRS